MKFGHLRRLDGGANDRIVAWVRHRRRLEWHIRRPVLWPFLLMAMFAAGCSSTRFSSMNTQPEPLQAAPAGQVTFECTAAAGFAWANRSRQFPGSARRIDGRRARSRPAQIRPPARLTSRRQAWPAYGTLPCPARAAGWRRRRPSSAPAIAPARCAVPAPVDGVKSWNVAGKQLSLYDESGGVVARLYSSGPEKFNGQTSTGLPISLYSIDRLSDPLSPE